MKMKMFAIVHKAKPDVGNTRGHVYDRSGV
jgi:hypothetical protein